VSESGSRGFLFFWRKCPGLRAAQGGTLGRQNRQKPNANGAKSQTPLYGVVRPRAVPSDKLTRW